MTTRWRILLTGGSVLLLATLVMVVIALSELSSYESSQFKNRVKNVATWCNGINTVIDYDLAFVSKFHVLPYTLKNLPCAAIEQKTEASAK
jgi:hypothetical protein